VESGRLDRCARRCCDVRRVGGAWHGRRGHGLALQAARDIIAGHDPYVQPVTVDDAGNLWPTNPVTTAMPFLPFTWAPDAVIAAVFFGAMSALLAYGLTKEGKLWPLLTFASPAYVACVVYVQWAPLILATYYLPQLLPLALVKPSIALPVLLTRLNLKRALACGYVRRRSSQGVDQRSARQGGVLGAPVLRPDG